MNNQTEGDVMDRMDELTRRKYRFAGCNWLVGDLVFCGILAIVIVQVVRTAPVWN